MYTCYRIFGQALCFLIKTENTQVKSKKQGFTVLQIWDFNNLKCLEMNLHKKTRHAPGVHGPETIKKMPLLEMLKIPSFNHICMLLLFIYDLI